MRRTVAIVFLAMLGMPAMTTAMVNQEAARVNPIRKVVTMLQAMQKKVEAEGEKEKELFEKYMCYCKTAGSDLSKSVADAKTKMPQVGSDIKEGEAKLAGLKEDLKQHQVDRSAAKEAIASATALREKEAASYAKESSELSANIAAMKKAVAALESGMAGGFLQTNTANMVKQIVTKNKDLDEDDRTTLTEFFQGSTEYAPKSGEITGILKTMTDEMSKSLADATAEEDAAIKAFEELVAAKNKEISALTASIESKTVRVGELSVEIVQMKNDLSDTEEALMEDEKFLKDMEKNCATKTAEWEEIVKTRSEELLALADTIKVLNDDDALELFKKALPASFIQVTASTEALRKKALAKLMAARGAFKNDRPHFDFVALAIKGKKIGFDKVIKMIDDMVATLKKEQMDDDHKKEYCAAQFDLADDKKKGLERKTSDLETTISDAKDGIATLKTEIETLEDSIKALDKSVQEATEQRKEEHEDFTELMASDSAAKELLGFAKNRLNKFYNPKLYKAPPKRVLSEEEQLSVSMGGTLPPTEAPGGIAGTGVTAFVQIREHRARSIDAPPPAPEAPGAYKKKGEESSGVIAMIDLIVKDLDKEMTEAETSEKDGQEDYEGMMKDSADKRAEDTKMLTDKEATLADLSSSLEGHKEDKVSTDKELGATLMYINSLHAECDWLLQYFDVRKEARDSEIDALGKAKAVLSGADFSLVQTSAQKFLARA